MFPYICGLMFSNGNILCSHKILVWFLMKVSYLNCNTLERGNVVQYNRQHLGRAQQKHPTRICLRLFQNLEHVSSTVYFLISQHFPLKLNFNQFFTYYSKFVITIIMFMYQNIESVSLFSLTSNQWSSVQLLKWILRIQ